MNRMKIRFFSLALVCLMVTGCQTVNQGAQELGKPVGKAMNVPQAVAEGAVEGMDPQKQEDSQNNPFNR